jgi:hypothetical protein
MYGMAAVEFDAHAAVRRTQNTGAQRFITLGP